jgi:hypothetical protein
MKDREACTNGRSGTLIEPPDFIVPNELVGLGKAGKNWPAKLLVAANRPNPAAGRKSSIQGVELAGRVLA